MIIRRNSITITPSWFNLVVRRFTMPIAGRDRDGLASTTSLWVYSVSPSNTSAGSRASS